MDETWFWSDNEFDGDNQVVCLDGALGDDIADATVEILAALTELT